MNYLSKQLVRGTAVWILMLAFWLMVGSAVQKSATVDEQSHLFRGVAYIKERATFFLLGHPLTASAISALPVLTEPNLTLPVESDAWENGDWSLAGHLFLWQENNHPQRILFLGRLPVMWITLLLGALVYRWGREWRGETAALLAMGLTLLDPNVLAHGRIISGDAVMTFFFTLTLYASWKWARTLNLSPEPGVRGRFFANPWLLVTGFGLGMAAASKFNGILLVPIISLLLIILWVRHRKRHFIFALLPVGLTTLLVIWAVNGFAIFPFPGGPFWQDLFWQLNYAGEVHGVYLAGRSSTAGWWYYFPVAFLVKMPLVTLLLLTLAFFRYFLRQNGANDAFVWLFLLGPAVLYLTAGATIALNIGFRYMLPMLPLLAIFTAVQVSPNPNPNLAASSPGHHSSFTIYHLPFVLLLILTIQSLIIYPDFIPFFNLLAGGSQNGWRILSDSNVDWGQDLPQLAAWQAENGVETLYLSYFGTAVPSAYGVDFTPLPTWGPTPEQGDPARQVFNPIQPAPGVYAISVTHLHGVVLGQNRDIFAYFRTQTPEERIGDSIFVYRVARNGPALDVAFSQIRPLDLDPALQFATNDIRIRWFDHSTSMIWPAEGGYMVVPDTPPHHTLAPFWPSEPNAVADSGEQLRYHLPPPPEIKWEGGGTPVGEDITFLGARVSAGEAKAFELLTAWRSEQQLTQPYHIFIHALDAQGEIIGQWDGLDSEITTWLSGDVFVQFHSFAIREPTAVNQFAVGLYNPATGDRLREPIYILYRNR